MGNLGCTEILLLLLSLSTFVPLVKILNKAGYSGAWVLLALIPMVNLVALWIFAFSTWPSQTRES